MFQTFQPVGKDLSTVDDLQVETFESESFATKAQLLQWTPQTTRKIL